MDRHTIVSTFAILAGVALPAVAAGIAFGVDARIDVDAPLHILAIAGAAAFSFVAGLAAATVLQSHTRTASAQVTEMLRDLR